MVGQLRIYTINEGMMDSGLKLFKEEIAPMVIETGMGVETAWISEDRSKFIWIRTYEDIPDIEEPNEVFAMLCYRGIHYAKWVIINPFISEDWSLFNPRESQ